MQNVPEVDSDFDVTSRRDHLVHPRESVELQKDDLISNGMLDVTVQVKSASPNDAQEKATVPTFTGSFHPYEFFQEERQPDVVKLRPPWKRFIAPLSVSSSWTDQSFFKSFLSVFSQTFSAGLRCTDTIHPCELPRTRAFPDEKLDTIPSPPD